MWMRKHKESVLKFIKACVFGLGLMVLVAGLSKVLNRKTENFRLESFFTQDHYDVLFLGASHVRDGIFPLEFWNEFGIVSFNYSGSTSSIAQEYWAMRNAFDYISPKLVVIDCSQLSYDKKMSPTTGHMHEVIDPFPMSRAKLSAIMDLAEPEDWMQFIWRFSYYHDRWGELDENDFQVYPDHNIFRGATWYVNVGVPDEVVKIDRDDKLEQDTVSVAYLRKAIEECRDRNIDVLLTYLPFPASEEKQQEANRGYDIAEEYGIRYVNFLDMDLVNYDTDCLDSYAHLNPSGAGKIAAWLGAYIQENYNVPDRRGEEAYSLRWDRDYEAYREFKRSALREQNELKEYLMLLSDSDYSCCIYVDESASFTQKEAMLELIENAAWPQNVEKLREAVLSGEDYFLLVDNGGPCIWESADGEALDDISTTFGGVRYGTDDEEDRYLYIRDEGENYLASMKQKPDAEVMSEIKIIVIDRVSGELVDVAEFYENESHEKRGT